MHNTAQILPKSFAGPSARTRPGAGRGPGEGGRSEGGLSDEDEGGRLPHRENTNDQVRPTGGERSGRQRPRPWLPVVAHDSRNRPTACARAISALRRRGAASAIAPGAWGFTGPRGRVTPRAESRVRRNTSVYFTMSNLRRRPVVNEPEGTDRPSYA